MTTRHLPIAVRGFAVRSKAARKARSAPRRPAAGWPRYALLFDTETRTDAAQSLTFGSYRLCRWQEKGKRLVCEEEGLFHADDLAETDPEGFRCLREYARNHGIDLVSRSEFVETGLWLHACQAGALVVALNLPFDLSRLAVDCGPAKGAFLGGFSLVLWQYQDKKTGKWHPNRYRPRIDIQHIDSKKAFIRFTKYREPNPDDQRPADGAPPDPKHGFAGRFLDLKTLAFALTDRAHSLESACKAFEVEHPKTRASQHGKITAAYIDYNRRDVLASQELLERLREEFDRHPIDLDPWQAYSPASIAKAYLRKMGLRSPAEQFSGIPRKVIGHTLSAFFGGRAEARIRKTIVPVVHTDFTSMYPTVQALMGLWDFLSAEEIEVVDATEDLRKLLAEVSLDDCFRPQIWPEFVGFAQVVPEGDALPTRAQYEATEWTVGVNHLTAKTPLWFGIPDLVASKLLTRKPPRVLQAFRLVAKGRQPQLRPVRLRGGVAVDPKKSDLFRTVIEKRQRMKRNRKLSPEERDRTERFLKVFANSGSYGIFIEMNRKQTPAKNRVDITVYGRERSFRCRTKAPEDPGPFCFPPIASLITSAARLMLALLEQCVTDPGGSYAFADTDSMAIVANESGGLVPCEGGSYRLPDGTPAIRALSWTEVDSIVNRFETLNPYDRRAVPGSILKIEEVNFETPGGPRRQLFAYVISAKRYVLFTKEADGRPVIPNTKDAYSEHGLGHFLNPLDPDSEEKDWIRSIWQEIIEETMGAPRCERQWIHRPAVMRSSVSTPEIRNRFDRINRKKPYAKQVKPFNFLLSVPVASLEWPPGAHELGGFHPIAPYSSNPSEWHRIIWTDLHLSGEYRIKSEGHSNPAAIRVQTFEDVLDRFRVHPESKSAGPDGLPAHERTVGLLGRLDIHAISITHIGKETNLLEQQEEGVLIADPQAVYWCGGEWETARSNLDHVSISELSRLSGVPERRLREYRQGSRRPSAKRREAIVAALARMLDEREY